MLPAGGALQDDGQSDEDDVAQGLRTLPYPQPLSVLRDPVLTVLAHNASAFSCGVCAHTCPDFAALAGHRRTAHRATRFVDHFRSGCTCSIGFRSRAAVTKHAMACKDSSYAAVAAARDSAPPVLDSSAPLFGSVWSAPRREVDPPSFRFLSAAAPAVVAVAPSGTTAADAATLQSYVPPPLLLMMGTVASFP
ncbi:unnamed protein product [Peronospora belbahrii]|uniref:C2H2-type domain-containing protein n=1 Tax=Peronospora belbahrii TaxID=622444 RepID=A0ABN8D6C0_9STRA|nr:unnamed protein product [Peronospora belbahrii]